MSAPTTTISEIKLVEQLFLDLPIQQVLHSRRGTEFTEPWTSMYVDAIRDARYGDAVWARYHIYGDVEDGIVGGSGGKTVREVIKEDALSYRVNAPEEYFQALAFYAGTSGADGRADVIEVIANLDEEEVAELRAKEETERKKEERAEEAERGTQVRCCCM
ncbi:uncharacterized protein BO66DRAFT_163452 [Aspergillus aculeatinus CBS 121060]|uniref:Uncharacterized protein n=1 Tax=Aspergillus aculeatinus CBS 121060 TaxID=1448322 RepID=A0ACD1GZI2_9EURO|nr:hypothetical protein BO66DRAFT_163452 [Aspergillus aculeatinus CBS 121060]RAH66886.1 hypothetical protein BO66DRAFT_163452 [Aspergillus aculeatinus CBS 121060]